MRTCLVLLRFRTNHEYHGALIDRLKQSIKAAAASFAQEPEALTGEDIVILPVNWAGSAQALASALQSELSSEVIEDYAVLTCGAGHACKRYQEDVEEDEEGGFAVISRTWLPSCYLNWLLGAAWARGHEAHPSFGARFLFLKLRDEAAKEARVIKRLQAELGANTRNVWPGRGALCLAFVASDSAETVRERLESFLGTSLIVDYAICELGREYFVQVPSLSAIAAWFTLMSSSHRAIGRHTRWRPVEVEVLKRRGATKN